MNTVVEATPRGKSSDAAPRPADEALTFHRHYDPHATILLVGFFGAGKKTLGIIASVVLRRRFIDFDTYFQQEVQLSPQEFIARRGLVQYRDVELRLSHELLTKHDKGCVIVGLGAFASRPQQMLLFEFAQRHPIVYVRRNKRDLQQFVTTSSEKFNRIFELGNDFFESCSNFDFFNHTQTQPDPTSPAYLKLKETERLFVAFLRRIFGVLLPQTFSSDPFSDSDTFSLQVPLQWLDGAPQDLELLECGADAIALVITPRDIQSAGVARRLSEHIATLRRNSRAAIIIDVVAISCKSEKSKAHEKILGMILRLAPDAVILSSDLDDDIFRSLNHSTGFTKLIIGFHQKEPVGSREGVFTPSNIQRQTNFPQLGGIRVTGECISPDDNLQCVPFLKSMTAITNLPVFAYNTGALGRASICLNPTLSPVVLPRLQSEGITVQQAQHAMTSFFLLPRKKFTIFGQTVKYSLSPEMHNAAYDYCGLPHIYDTTQAEDISAVDGILAEEGRGGVTISLPFKSAILPFIDEITSDAEDMRAVNTVVLEHKLKSDGSRATIRKGYNTDHIGIRDCIDKHLSPANAVRDGTTALIVGAGGMARAAIYACYELGVQRICIFNRTPEHAQKLANYWNQWAGSKPNVNLQVDILRSTDAWPSDLRLPTIVVPCIPPFQIGSEHPVKFQIPNDWLESRTGGVFVEVAYGPFKTQLMEQMIPRASKGWVIVSGLLVLVEQGIAQYEIFTKRPAPVHVMRRVIQEQSAKYGFVHQ